jgi:hypothetical protein
MDGSQFDMAIQALQALFEWHRLAIVVFGVLLGL